MIRVKKRIFLFIFLISPLFLFPQMKKWVLGKSQWDQSESSPNTAQQGFLQFFEADFSGAQPLFTERTLGNSLKNIVSAGVNEGMISATDDAGNIAFYAFPNVVVPYNNGSRDTLYLVAFDQSTGKDEVFAKVNPESVCGNSIKETDIVKVDGKSNIYYFLYKTACINNFPNDSWKYVIVDLDSKSISKPITIMSEALNEGLAVSPFNCAMDNRWLFFVKYDNGNLLVYRSSITATGIAAPVLATSLNIPGNYSLGQGDIEISPLADKIAIANFTSSNLKEDIAILDLDIATGTLSNLRWIDSPENYMITLEFSPDGKRLYSFRGGTSAISASMYNIPVPTNSNYTISPSDLVNVPIKAAHSIEVGFDGQLYFTTTHFNSKLYYISNPNAAAGDNIINTTPNFSFGPWNGVSLALPDQIDGNGNFGLPISVKAKDTTICPGQSVKLTASGATLYQWSGGINANSASIQVTPTVTTAYFLKASNGCMEILDTIVITVTEPQVTITGNTNICKGQTTTLTANGGIQYQWSGGINSTNASIQVAPTVTTTYFLKTRTSCNEQLDTIIINVTDPKITITGKTIICKGETTTLTATGGIQYQWFGGINSTNASIQIAPIVTTTYFLKTYTSCGDRLDTVIITVTDPKITINGKTNICKGETTTLTANGGIQYQWSGGITSTNASIQVTPIVTTTYFLKTSTSCGELLDTIIITVTEPQISITGKTVICKGETTTLTATGGTQYQWSGGINSSNASIQVTPMVTTTYFLKASTSCKDLLDTIIITVTEPPVAITGKTSICIGDTTTLTATGGVQYQWSGGIVATTPSVTVSPVVSTTYSVVVFDGTCYSQPLPTTVTVNLNPIVTIIGQDTICTGDTLLYQAITEGASPFTYVWTNGGSSATTLFSALSGTSLGIKISDKNGCKGSGTISIHVEKRPEALFSADFQGCTPLEIKLSNHSVHASSYYWILGDGTFSGLTAPDHIYTTPGKYSISLIAKNNFCSDADTLTIKNAAFAFPVPVAGISYSLTTNEKQVEIVNLSKQGDSCTLFYGDGDFLNGCGWQKMIHNYLSDGEYIIRQIVSNIYGCRDTALIKINLETDGNLYYPNSFTPDGDGLNDVFLTYGFNVEEFKMSIFNRWGQLLFQSDAIHKGWDGTYKGQAVEQDVYVLKLDYRLKKGRSKTIYGHITLIK